MELFALATETMYLKVCVKYTLIKNIKKRRNLENFDIITTDFSDIREEKDIDVVA